MTNRLLARLGPAALAAAMIALVYLIAVWTPAGLAFDARVLAITAAAHPIASEIVSDLLATVFLPAMALALAGLAVIAIRTHRIAVTARAALAGVLAVATAEVLKVALPGRPGDPAAPLSGLLDLFNPAWWGQVRGGVVILSGSFPSGHSTVATAFALIFLTAVRPQLSRRLTVPLLLLAALVASATVIAGWHRPSDALAGMLLALAWWLLLARASTPRRVFTRQPLPRPMLTQPVRETLDPGVHVSRATGGP
jgi:membrane-associated phospholipid phosphatase